MIEPTNRERAERAKAILLIHQTLLSGDPEGELQFSPESVVADLLTDLRHYCDSRDMSFSRASELSAFHHRVEVAEQRDGRRT